MKLPTTFIAICCLFVSTASVFGQFSLIGVDPQRNIINVPVTKQIVLTFNDNVDAASIANGIFLESELRGILDFGVTVSGPSVTITANDPFLYAEDISVRLEAPLKSSSAVSISNPLAFGFKTLSKPSKVIPPNFIAKTLRTYESGGLGPMKPADMDGDGDIDLCVNLYGLGLGWLEATGGQLVGHSIEPGASTLADAIPVDIDRDGDMDVMSVSSYFGIYVYTNDGSQNFTITTTIEGKSISQPDLADFNADGLIDIVYSGLEVVNGNYVTGTWIAHNQGGGVFNKTKINSEINYKLRCVDLDNDGDWDVVQNNSEALSFLLNTGASFVSTLIPTPGVVIQDFALANVDGDGYMDIVLRGDGLRAFLNNGSLQFTQKTLLTSYDYSASYSVGDYDGDGDVDVVFMDGNYHYVMLVNDGNEDFTRMEITLSMIDLPSTNPAISGDFDGDGDLDFITNTSNTRITLFENTIDPFRSVSIPGNMAAPYGDSDWGDFDNDGDLDVVTTGLVGNNPVTKVFENQGGSFIETGAMLPGTFLSSCDWGDVDNDGDLDILLTGATSTGSSVEELKPKSLIYLNNNGVFNLLSSSEAQLPKVFHGEARFADLNNDGWLDIVYNAQGYSGVYQADGKGDFTKGYDFPGVSQLGNLDVGDFDNDGDLDVIVSGAVSRVFRNEGNWKFTNVDAHLIGRLGGNLSWTDVDNDGDLDVVVSGGIGLPSITVYKNQGGVFEAVVNNEFLYQVDEEGTTVTGDFTNDGFTDIIASTEGGSSYAPELTLLKGDGDGQFSVVNGLLLPKIASRNANWVDFDNDDDLDLFVGSELIRNNVEEENTAPVPPATIVVDSVYNNSIYLHWDDGHDEESGSGGISYQLYAGTGPGTQDVVNSNSNLVSGFRKVSESGKLKSKRTTITQLSGGMYYFGAQSIDAAFKGSPFSAEYQQLVISINGPAAICDGMTSSYSTKPAGTYTWLVSGGIIMSGQGSDKIEVNWNVAGKGTVKLTDGLGSSNTLPVDIDVRPNPSIVGDNTVCTGVEKYTVVDALTHFVEWTVSADHSIENSSTPEAKVEWKKAGEYDLSVKAFPEHRGCFAVEMVRVSVDKRPTATITGEALICIGETKNYSSSASDPVWSVVGGTVTRNAPPNIDVIWPNVGRGEVTLLEKSVRAFCSTQKTLLVDVKDRPPKPILTLIRDTIVSSPSPNGYYAWYYNGERVIGGSYNALISRVSGEFVVEVFNTWGCGTKSNPLFYVVTAIVDSEAQVQGSTFSLYPNPADQFLKVLLDDPNAGACELEIVSITNATITRKAYENANQLSLAEIDVSQLAQGIYMIRLITKDGTYHEKFIKK